MPEHLVENVAGDLEETMARLSRDMSVEDFDDGYFYVAELEQFAREIGIAIGSRRKIELENLIREYLSTKRVPASKATLPRKSGQARDLLAPDVLVTNYVGDQRTKTFLLDYVYRKAPGLRAKPGQWYWLNDWRRAKQEARAKFTYADLADHVLELMMSEGRLPQIPSARMNNFKTDFRAGPCRPALSGDEVLEAWHWLKKQPGPNTYAEYRRLRPHADPSE